MPEVVVLFCFVLNLFQWSGYIMWIASSGLESLYGVLNLSQPQPQQIGKAVFQDPEKRLSLRQTEACLDDFGCLRSEREAQQATC